MLTLVRLTFFRIRVPMTTTGVGRAKLPQSATTLRRNVQKAASNRRRRHRRRRQDPRLVCIDASTALAPRWGNMFLGCL